MTARSAKTLELAIVVVVSATLLDPRLPVLLAAVFLLVQVAREVRRARRAHSKRPKRV